MYQWFEAPPGLLGGFNSAWMMALKNVFNKLNKNATNYGI